MKNILSLDFCVEAGVTFRPLLGFIRALHVHRYSCELSHLSGSHFSRSNLPEVCPVSFIRRVSI